MNARYIHSNPGVYSLRAFAKERLPEAEIQIAEYTINHQMDRILQDIYRKKPDFVGFSCYIWNISQVYELARDLKQVLPETEIWLGGPEVSYDSGRILSQEPEIRGIMRGEGELTFSQVAEAYLAAEDRLAGRGSRGQGSWPAWRGSWGSPTGTAPERFVKTVPAPPFYG